jgi:hypothetical protein
MSRASPRIPRKTPRPKRSGKAGLPAGALVHLGERKTERAAITLIEYGGADLQ